METKTLNTEILNDLVQINNDRVAGYEKAIDELKPEDADLKALFVKMIGESHTYKMALATEVQVLGDEIEEGTTNSGKIYRAWMDVKAAFTGNDRHTILDSCEFGEDKALETYASVLENATSDLTAEQTQLVSQQQTALRADHDRVKALRDATA